jgi:hypothetical protein
MFGLKKDEVIVWIKLHHENFMVSVCSMNEGKRNVYRVLVGNPEGNRPLGRPRCRWKDNIKMVLRER